MRVAHELTGFPLFSLAGPTLASDNLSVNSINNEQAVDVCTSTTGQPLQTTLDASIDPSLFGPPATEACPRESSPAQLPTNPQAAQPIDIATSLALAPDPAAPSAAAGAKGALSISVSRPPSAARRDDILPIEPRVGSDSGMEDVKPSLRDLLQSAATSEIPTPPRKQHDAVAEPSKTLSPRQSTVSIAPSTASGTTASLTFRAAAGEASVRTIARESPAPPSTSSGQDDFAPVWSSQKPPDGNGKRKAEGTLSSAHPTKAKSSRLDTDPDDGGTSEVVSDVDELEDQAETERPPDETQRSRNLPPTIESRFMHRRRTANGKTSLKAAAMKAQSTSKPVTTKAQAASNAAQTSPYSAAGLAPALESAHSSAMNLHQARTAIHYQSLGWLLQPAEFYRDVNGRLIFDALVELHDAERDANCIQILAGLIQQFCP